MRPSPLPSRQKNDRDLAGDMISLKPAENAGFLQAATSCGIYSEHTFRQEIAGLSRLKTERCNAKTSRHSSETKRRVCIEAGHRWRFAAHRS